MRLSLLGVCTLLCLSVTGSVAGQDVKVSRENKIISVSATGTVSLDPNLAEVRIGYQSYGPSKEAAFEENVRVATKILEELKAAGLKETQIETREITIERVDLSDHPEALRSQRQYEAAQHWIIRVSPPDAQAVIDLAVLAGANDVKDVAWKVVDFDGLEAKAHAVAVTKARALAQQMASEMGLKLGDILYVSNRQEAKPESIPVSRDRSQFIEHFWMRRPTSLKLFPQKVECKATVYVTFAIQ